MVQHSVLLSKRVWNTRLVTVDSISWQGSHTHLHQPNRLHWSKGWEGSGQPEWHKDASTLSIWQSSHPSATAILDHQRCYNQGADRAHKKEKSHKVSQSPLGGRVSLEHPAGLPAMQRTRNSWDTRRCPDDFLSLCAFSFPSSATNETLPQGFLGIACCLLQS